MGIKAMFIKAGAWTKRKSPELLTAFGISAMLTGVVLAVKATPKAMKAIEDKKEEEGHDKLTTLQTIQAAGKHYIPTAVAEAVGAISIIGADRAHNKRETALISIAEIGQRTARELNEYRRIVADRIGEKKEADAYHELTQQRVNRNPPPPDMYDDDTANGAPKPKCYNNLDGRYFYKSYDDVKASVNKMNSRINNSTEGYVSLNDLYDDLDVERTKMGDLVGWSLETGLIEIPDKEDLQYAGTPNGWPCWVLEFTNPPQYEYMFFRKH